MRRILAVLALLALSACTGAQLPVGSGAKDGPDAGEAFLVASLSLDMQSWFGRYKPESVNLLFAEYDPVTQRLMPGGERFSMVRSHNGLLRSFGGDFALPNHQVYSLKPGHYISYVANIIWPNGLGLTGSENWFVAYEGNAVVGNHPIDDADVSKSPGFRVQVLPGTVTYAGDLHLIAQGKEGLAPSLLTAAVRRDDEAARRALGVTPVTSELTFQPFETSLAGH